MRRRGFVAGMTASVVAWPLPASAQSQTAPLIGFLGAASPEGYEGFVGGLRQGLKETGFVAAAK